MFTRHRTKTKLFFHLAELTLLALAFEAAYEIRSRLPGFRLFFLTPPIKALLLSWSCGIWFACGHWYGIYDHPETAIPSAAVKNTLRQAGLLAVAIVLFEYALRLDLSRFFLTAFVALGASAVGILRFNGQRLAALLGHEPNLVVVVGSNSSALAAGRQLEAASAYGIQLIGFLSEEREQVATCTLEKEYPVWPIRYLPRLLNERVIDEIIFAVDSRNLAGLEEAFLLCEEEGVRTRLAVDFFPHVNSEIFLEWLGALPLLTFSASPHDEFRLLLKRLIDVVAAGAALILLSPIMLLTAILIWLSSPGPVIFSQVRCGLNGRRFTIYKFRSMTQDAEERKSAIEHLNERDQVVFKIKDDPRATPLGRWLRKFSIDEWPQLWNVVKGDMSLVGPRPAIPEEVEQYQRWQRRRLRMRPGLTCLWAISGRDALDFDRWMKLDMQYIDSWSLGLDWKIIFRTVPLVISGRGAN